MSPRLATETATYEAHKEQLLAEHRGKFVLIHGSEIVWSYDTQRDALVAGYGKSGYIDLFTKRLTRREKKLSLGCTARGSTSDAHARSGSE